MRRKTERALANAGRAVALGVCAVAAVVFLLWDRATLAPLEQHLQQRFLERRLRPVVNLALSAPGQGAAELRPRLEELAEGFAGVRLLDSLAEGARAARWLLAEVAGQQADTTTQLRVLQEAVRFDPNDLAAAARLHALRCRTPALQPDAVEQLLRLARESANSPAVVRWLLDALTGLGRPQDVLEFLAKTRDNGVANGWRVSCQGLDADGEPVPVADVGGGGMLRLGFVLPAGTTAVRVHVPAHASFLLQDAKLHVAHAATAVTIDACDRLDVGTTAIDRVGRGLRAFGDEQAVFQVEVDLPDEWSMGLVHESSCVFEAVLTPRPSRLLASAVLSPEFTTWGGSLDAASPARAAWAEWRGHALEDVLLALEAAGGAWQQAAICCHDDRTFTATWPIGGDATELSFELPPGRACHPWRTIEVENGRDQQVVDVATAPDLRLQGVVRTGPGLVVTGEPRPRVVVPIRAMGKAATVTVRGQL